MVYIKHHWRTPITAESIEVMVDKEISLRSRNYDGGQLEDIQAEISAMREIICLLARCVDKNKLEKILSDECGWTVVPDYKG